MHKHIRQKNKCWIIISTTYYYYSIYYHNKRVNKINEGGALEVSTMSVKLLKLTSKLHIQMKLCGWREVTKDETVKLKA